MKQISSSSQTIEVGMEAFRFISLTIAIVFAAGCGGGSSSTTHALAVAPPSVTLAPNQRQEFQSGGLAPVDSRSTLEPDNLSWEVVEGESGGAVEAVEGVPERLFVTYTAPLNPGTYHVKATAHYADGATKTSIATVEVK